MHSSIPAPVAYSELPLVLPARVFLLSGHALDLGSNVRRTLWEASGGSCPTGLSQEPCHQT